MWRLYKFIMLCFEIFSGFRVPKIITIIIILVTCKFLLRVSQGIVATFCRRVEQSYNIAYFQFFQDKHTKIIKIGSFLTELLKIKMSPLFWNTIYKFKCTDQVKSCDKSKSCCHGDGVEQASSPHAAKVGQGWVHPWVGLGLEITAFSWIGYSWNFFLGWVEIRLMRFYWCKVVAWTDTFYCCGL